MNDINLSRRDWLRLSSLGVLGTSLSGWLPQLAARAANAPKRERKSCILLWMDGGPSQCHTFTLPKTDAEYKAIPTAVPGIHISEHLPKLADRMKDLALIRTMSTDINNHGAGQYLMHTGHRASTSIDYPTLGSIVSRECTQTDTGLPNFIVVGSSRVAQRFHRSGALGSDHAAMMVAGRSISNLKPPVRDRAEARLSLLDEVHRAEYRKYRSAPIQAHSASYRKAIDLMKTDRVKAFDVKSEPAKDREAYGTGTFGEGCLLARRLVEAGVAFVEVSWGGWDHHGGAAGPVKKRSPELDRGFSALITDLKQRGLLDTTLVVWMGEFGRGPKPGLGGRQQRQDRLGPLRQVLDDRSRRRGHRGRPSRRQDDPGLCRCRRRPRQHRRLLRHDLSRPRHRPERHLRRGQAPHPLHAHRQQPTPATLLVGLGSLPRSRISPRRGCRWTLRVDRPVPFSSLLFLVATPIFGYSSPTTPPRPTVGLRRVPAPEHPPRSS